MRFSNENMHMNRVTVGKLESQFPYRTRIKRSDTHLFLNLTHRTLLERFPWIKLATRTIDFTGAKAAFFSD